MRIAAVGPHDMCYGLLSRLIAAGHGVTLLREKSIGNAILLNKFELVLVSPQTVITKIRDNGYKGPILTISRSDAGSDVGPSTSLEDLNKIVAKFSATPERPP